MATVTETDAPETFADLLERIGNVPLDRIRMRPAPGTATEKDVIAALEAANKRLYELVDGVLVEKPMGAEESLLAGIIIQILWNFVEPRKIGYVFAPDAAVRLFPKLIRIPDVSVLRRDRLPGGKWRKEKVISVAPDLAVEVLSEGNTEGEMKRKLRDYFLAGIRVVWLIDPRKRTAEVYSSPGRKKRLRESQSLDGGDILPGFSLPLRELFGRADD